MKQTRSGLVIVGDVPVEERPFVCRICNTDLTRAEYANHVSRCYERNEAELRMSSFRERAPGIFDPNRSGDVEFGRWISANREALIEGRKRM